MYYIIRLLTGKEKTSSSLSHETSLVSPHPISWPPFDFCFSSSISIYLASYSSLYFLRETKLSISNTSVVHYISGHPVLSRIGRKIPETMDPELLRTCQQGDIEKLRKLFDTRSHDHEFFLSQKNEEQKNILHILFSPGKQACAEEALSRLPSEVVRQLVCQPDIHGDNPLHLAASCGFLGAVKLLVGACKDLRKVLWFSPPWTETNNRGKLPVQVAVARCHDEVAEFLLSVDRHFPYNVENAGSLLDDSVTNGCERTGVRLLERHPEEVFKRRQSSDKMEILELAIEKDVVDIIEMILNIDTSISYDLQNEDGENPLHIAVERGRLKIAQILVDAFNEYLKRQVEGDAEAAAHLLSLQPPWRQMDKRQRTPLHRALVDGYLDLAKVMLSSDFAFLSRLADHSEQDSPNSLVKELEDSKEFRDVYLDTFLQFIRDNRGEATKKLIEQHPELVRFKDNSGRTILHQASNENDVDTMIFILRAVNIPDYELVPLLIEVDDAGKHQTTALHKVRQQSREKYKELLAIPAIKLLKNKTDAFGRTPLIKAIQDSDLHLAETLVLDIEGVDVLSIKSENEKTAAALLKDKSKEAKESGADDGWENLYNKAAQATRYIPLGTDLKEIRNTLSVVAGLLITITIGAGFTVISHIDQNNGHAHGRWKPTFIIFVLSDTYAMCCSVIVLYGLIWAAVQEPDKALKLIDYSVTLLHHSFYGTLVAFSTGAYTMLLSISIWVAISVLVMCSTIMIFACIIFRIKFVHKFLVDKFLDKAESSV